MLYSLVIQELLLIIVGFLSLLWVVLRSNVGALKLLGEISSSRIVEPIIVAALPKLFRLIPGIREGFPKLFSIKPVV